MDGVSVAASIVGIATLGVQLSIKVITLKEQVATASDRISTVANDVSLTSSILQQLVDIIKEQPGSDNPSVLSKSGLETTRTSAEVCKRIFEEVEDAVAKASEMLKASKHRVGEKVKLSVLEKAKWPFLQPGLEILRTELREAKNTLMLMLQVASLAAAQHIAKMTVSTSANITEQKNMIRSILILQKQHQHQRQRPQQIAMMVDTERSFENLSIDSASPGNNTDNHESESDDRPRSLSPGANVNSSYLSATVQEMPDSTQISDPNSPAALKDDHVPELEWYSLKPKLDVFKDMIQITWHHRRLPAPTDQPNEVKSQEKHDLTLPNSITLKSLPEFERGLVCGSLDLIKSSSRWKTLTSLTVEEQDLQKGDVTFKNVPSFQLVVRLRSHKPRRAPRFLDTATQRRRQDWSVSLRPAQDQTHSIDIDEFGFATPMTSKKDRTKHSTIDYRDSGIRTPADIMRNRRDREARRKEEYLRLDSERQDKVSSVSFSGGGYIRSEAGPLRISTAGLRYQEDLMPEKEHDIHSDSDIDTNPSIIQGGRGDYVRENLDDWTNEPVRPRFTTRISEPRPADDEDAEYSALAEVMREYTTVGSAWA